MKTLKYLPLLGLLVLAGTAEGTGDDSIETSSQERREKYQTSYTMKRRFVTEEDICNMVYIRAQEKAKLICYENHKEIVMTALTECSIVSSDRNDFNQDLIKVEIDFFCE